MLEFFSRNLQIKLDANSCVLSEKFLEKIGCNVTKILEKML
jgi:hypothetical protein